MSRKRKGTDIRNELQMDEFAVGKAQSVCLVGWCWNEIRWTSAMRRRLELQGIDQGVNKFKADGKMIAEDGRNGWEALKASGCQLKEMEVQVHIIE